MREEDNDLVLIVGGSRGVDQMAALEAIRQEIPFYYYLAYLKNYLISSQQ